MSPSATENGPGPSKKIKLSNADGEFEFTVSEITMECDNASVHGVIRFTGEPTDGQTTVKFACTNPSWRSNLRSNPATLGFKSNKVLGVRGGGTLYTRIAVLDKLEDLKNKLVRTLLTVSGKIVSVDDPCEVSNSNGVRFKMKECKLADSTVTVTLKVWEDEIDKVVSDSCYQFINVRKREYEGQCFLSTTKHSKINEINDIGEVSTVELPSTPREVSGEIFAVVKVDKYKKCPFKECSSRVYRSGKCNKCKREIALSQCEEEIRVHFSIEIKDETTKTTTYCEMAAFKRELDQMVQNGIRSTATKSKIVDMLLKTKPMTFVINQKNNVTEVRDIVPVVTSSSKEDTFPIATHDRDFCTIL